MLNVKVISPKEVLFEGEAEHVLVPSPKGILGIFPSHTPFYGEITPGNIEINGQSSKSFEVVSGIIKVRKDNVTLLIGL